MTKKTTIAILTKSPEPGKVKTRFNLTGIEASEIYHSFLSKIYQTVRHSDLDLHWFIEGDLSYFKLDIPREFIHPQKGDSLSQRIKFAMKRAKELCYDNVIVIGGDSPELELRDFEQTATVLEEEVHVVLGPTFDGGIYLLGQNLSLKTEYLDDMIWSTESVYDDLKANLELESMTYISKELKHDLDTYDDYSNYLKRMQN